MKKTKKLLSGILAMSMAFVLGFGMTACKETGPDVPPGPDGPNPQQPVKEVKVIIATPSKTTLQFGDRVSLTATVENAEDTGVEWSSEDPSALTVDQNGNVEVVGKLTSTRTIKVTATSKQDNTKSASYTFTVIPTKTGEYNELNADVFEEVSDSNLTVTGTVTDVYFDSENSYNNDRTEYDMKVMMEDGKWYGEWSAKPTLFNQNPTKITDNYRRGEDALPSGDHAFETIYVDMHNEVVRKAQKTWDSRYITWESQYLWNWIGDLGTNISADKFEYEPEYNTYRYLNDFSVAGDQEYSDDAWLMTKLAYSLTPMLEDTFAEFRLELEDGHIRKIHAQTIAQSVQDENGKVLQQAYTEVELTISDIGSTVVPEPAPYVKDPNDTTWDAFVGALETMKNAKNYAFRAVDTALTSGSYSDDDYSYESDISTVAYHKHEAMNGTVGTIGYITESVALFEETSEYTSYDTNPYVVDYSGYKQYFDEDGNPTYYETFGTTSYDASVSDKVTSLVATKRKDGDMFKSVLPAFDFAPEIFQSMGVSSTMVNGKLTNVARYVLRDSSLTSDVARQISAAGNADSAAESAVAQVEIQIDENGNIIQTIFPYNIADTWTGYITTTFAAVGETTLDPADFSEPNYIPRAWKAEWSQYTAKDYPSSGETIPADDLLETMFGAKALELMPKPELFMNLFGDDISGPWYEEKNIYPEDGDYNSEPIGTIPHFDITIRTDDPSHYDENNRLVDVAGLFGAEGVFTQALLGLNNGWEFDIPNSGFYNNDSSSDTFYASYINEEANVQIVVETNGTWNLFFEIYEMGKWHKSK